MSVGSVRVDTRPLEPLGLAHNGFQKSQICEPGFQLLRSFRKQRVVFSLTFQRSDLGEVS